MVRRAWASVTWTRSDGLLMWVILYLAGIIAWLLAAQAVVLRVFNEPPQWTYGASSRQPKKLRLVLKAILQATLIGSSLLFPYLVGSTPGRYYGPMLPADRVHHFLYGQLLALALMASIFGLEVMGGWLYWQPRFPAKKAFSKSLLSALSSLTVVAVEEPFFRGIILTTLLASLAPAVAVPLSAALFSAAHFLRKVSSYWPFVGLAVLGLWLGVAYHKTGSLWLPMGLHSGGILTIGLHRCFLNYRGPVLWTGTQTFPIAGLTGILVMLAGTFLTWRLLP